MDNNSERRIKKRLRKKMVDKIIIGIMFLLGAVLCFSSYKIILWYQDNKANKDLNQNAIDMADIEESTNGKKVNAPKKKFDPYWDFIDYPLINVNFDKLLQYNPDTVGWIYMRKSNINYPVVQKNNNTFYLNHSYNKKYNDAGWVFMDYRNNPEDFKENTIIYAHSRVDRSMFGTLRNAVKESWFKDKENHIIKFSTPKENTLWLVFSSYTINEESNYLRTDFMDKNDYESWLIKMKKRSKFDYETEVGPEDKTLTLSSCYTADGIRIAVHAKLIKVENRENSLEEN